MCSRRLQNVKNVGFKISHAYEHTILAKTDRKRANTQLEKGLDTLRHVKWNEMDDNQRMAHEGQLMCTQALKSQLDALERRTIELERAMRGLHYTKNDDDLSNN